MLEELGMIFAEEAALFEIVDSAEEAWSAMVRLGSAPKLRCAKPEPCLRRACGSLAAVEHLSTEAGSFDAGQGN